MQNSLKNKIIDLTIAGICCLALSGALIVQNLANIQACELCIVTRYLFIVIFLTTIFLKKRYGAEGFIILSSVTGIFINIAQISNHSAQKICGYSNFMMVLNESLFAKIIPWMFEVRGTCSMDVVLGIPIPVMAIIAFLGILILGSISFYKKYKTNRKITINPKMGII